MENPQDAKLSEIRQLLEYQQQLSSMLPYVGPKLRRQLTTLEEQSTNSDVKFFPAAATAREKML